jgi:hypothetical protein
MRSRSATLVFDYGLVALVSVLVPAARRTEWRREWRAELWQLHQRRSQDPSPVESAEAITESLSLARGLVTDAMWLGWDGWREHGGGTASACLQSLFAASFVCAVVERALAGSWHSFFGQLAGHFAGCYQFVVLPAIFVGAVTAPLRQRKCERKHPRMAAFLSADTRWNLFFAAKVLLTLLVGFLVSAVITISARKVIGHWADFVELMTTALVVILSLRWALLNQELRCQHCLRMLSQPTRVGPPSHNFLEWNGTELICSAGHGLLHVTELQGSWCW